MAYTTCSVPAGGKISIVGGQLQVPAQPIIPFIRGDGTGPDIWAASVRVFDAAVLKAYGGQRRISWFEVFAGEESFKKFNNWLPDDTVEAFKEYLVGIKGPLGPLRMGFGEGRAFPKSQCSEQPVDPAFSIQANGLGRRDTRQAGHGHHLAADRHHEARPGGKPDIAHG